MTRALVVLALVAALSFAARSFLPDTTTLTGSGAALAFGFLLLSALQIGHVFHALRLPHLTGFLLCGAVFGPEVLGLLTTPMLHDLTVVKKVAVGLIALLAGCELSFSRLWPRLRSIGLVSLFGLSFAAVCIYPVLFVAITRLPWAAEMTFEQRAIVALVCTNVLVALSPSVVLGILSETRAQGPLSEICLSIVILADLVIAVSFAFTDSFTRGMMPGEGEAPSLVGALGIHILGSMVVGVGVGTVIAVYVRRVGLRVGLFIFAILFVVAEAGSALHLDPLLVGLSAGLFVENVSPVSGESVMQQTQIAAMPTFAVFFAVVGAEIHLHAFLAVAPWAIACALARAAGLWSGARLGAKLARTPPELARRIPFGMFPQAGIAIALANLVKESFDPWGKEASILLLGTIVVNEMVGPIGFRHAIVAAGEAGKRHGGHGAKPSHASIPDEAREGGAMAGDTTRAPEPEIALAAAPSTEAGDAPLGEAADGSA